METNKKSPVFNNYKFICISCDYYSNKISDYEKHLSTAKHKRRLLANEKSPTELCRQNNVYACDCGNNYKHLSSLYKHKKTCSTSIEPIVLTEAPSLLVGIKEPGGSNEIPMELILEVIKQSKEVQNVLIEQNKELQTKLLEKENKLLEKENQLLEQNEKYNEQILELAKKPNIINSNNNNTFNLNVFLNEKCKDAMNIVDFINSLQLTTDDFETTGRLGFVNGISKIFISQLKKVDVVSRPLHCTDLKRETLYIKDNDKWEKDNEEKKKLKWAVNRIAQLNLNQIQQWQKKYPDCVENNTPANEKFTELALVALGGRGDEEIDKFNEKIMKNVIKEIVVDKM
jgi:hypothetical protein